MLVRQDSSKTRRPELKLFVILRNLIVAPTAGRGIGSTSLCRQLGMTKLFKMGPLSASKVGAAWRSFQVANSDEYLNHDYSVKLLENMH